MKRWLFASLVIVFMFPAFCVAQDQQLIPIYSLFTRPQSDEDLVYRETKAREWIEGYKKDIAWDEQWLNVYGYRGFYKKRRVHTPPPVWLGADCQEMFEDNTGVFTEACQLFGRWKDDFATSLIKGQTLAAITKVEHPKKTSFLENLHLDTGWFLTQGKFFASGVYAPIGIHYTINIGSHLEVFPLPGVLMTRIFGEWHPAYDWGFSVRLFEFKTPIAKKGVVTHLNIVKAWPSGMGPIDMGGFSFTFKK